MRPNLTPQQRSIHAREWRDWRKASPAGARRAWVYLRKFVRAQSATSRLLDELGKCSAASIPREQA